MSKILVAEDNLPNRELIREILEACGYDVIEAGDGQQVEGESEKAISLRFHLESIGNFG